MEKQALWQAYHLQQERIKNIPKWGKVALAGANMALQAYRKKVKGGIEDGCLLTGLQSQTD